MCEGVGIDLPFCACLISTREMQRPRSVSALQHCMAPHSMERQSRGMCGTLEKTEIFAVYLGPSNSVQAMQQLV